MNNKQTYFQEQINRARKDQNPDYRYSMKVRGSTDETKWLSLSTEELYAIEQVILSMRGNSCGKPTENNKIPLTVAQSLLKCAKDIRDRNLKFNMRFNNRCLAGYSMGNSDFGVRSINLFCDYYGIEYIEAGNELEIHNNNRDIMYLFSGHHEGTIHDAIKRIETFIAHGCSCPKDFDFSTIIDK